MLRRDFLKSGPLLPSALQQATQAITHVETRHDGTVVTISIVRAQDVSSEGSAPGAKAFVQFNGSTAQLAAFASGFVTLEPGAQPHPPHRHPEEEIMIVGEGNEEFSLDGVTRNVGVGDTLFAEANLLHGVRNTDTTRMIFYFIKMQGKP